MHVTMNCSARELRDLDTETHSLRPAGLEGRARCLVGSEHLIPGFLCSRAVQKAIPQNLVEPCPGIWREPNPPVSL
jgi:hypothetical protein